VLCLFALNDYFTKYKCFFNLVGVPNLLSMMLMVSAVKETQEPSATVENFVEVTVPLYSKDDFHAHFRMQRSTFEVVLFMHILCY